MTNLMFAGPSGKAAGSRKQVSLCRWLIKAGEPAKLLRMVRIIIGM